MLESSWSLLREYFESRPVTNKKEDGSDDKRLASQILFEYGKLIFNV
jgi:hypothetical protein